MKKTTLNISRFAIISLIILSFISVSNSYSLKLGKYYLSEKSRIWFDGTSNLSDFTCMTSEIKGEAVLDSVQGMTRIETWKDSDTKYFADAFFNIRSKSLDCGNDMMNDDMYDALKTDDFSKISFQLEKVKLLLQDKKNNSTNVIVGGYLTVAGVTRHIEFNVEISAIDNNNEYRILTKISINMLDYGIEPPSAVFGLIKADENLTLFLDLYVTTDQYSSR